MFDECRTLAYVWNEEMFQVPGCSLPALRPFLFAAMLPLCRRGCFRESMFDCLSQAITSLPRVASPMAEDASIGSDDQRLRNRVAPVHQRYCRLAVGPAQAEAEFEVA